MNNAVVSGPINGWKYIVSAECDTEDEANQKAEFLNRSIEIEKRLELAEDALTDFAFHSSGVMAPNAKYNLWRKFLNENHKSERIPAPWMSEEEIHLADTGRPLAWPAPGESASIVGSMDGDVSKSNESHPKMSWDEMLYRIRGKCISEESARAVLRELGLTPPEGK